MDRRRLNLDLLADTCSKAEQIQTRLTASSISEVIRRAINLLYLCTQPGITTLLRKKDGSEEIIKFL